MDLTKLLDVSIGELVWVMEQNYNNQVRSYNIYKVVQARANNKVQLQRMWGGDVENLKVEEIQHMLDLSNKETKYVRFNLKSENIIISRSALRQFDEGQDF